MAVVGQLVWNENGTTLTKQLLSTAGPIRRRGASRDRASSQAGRNILELLHAGIDRFIDLTIRGEPVPYAEKADNIASSLGLKVEWKPYPIPDLSVPRAREQMTRILDAVDDALSKGRTIYVHCWGRGG